MNITASYPNVTDDCTICLLEMTSKETITLPCNHSFHNNCFQLWKNYNNACPYCRYNLEIDRIPTVLYDELMHQMEILMY
jgi:hypothetical protein